MLTYCLAQCNPSHHRIASSSSSTNADTNTGTSASARAGGVNLSPELNPPHLYPPGAELATPIEGPLPGSGSKPRRERSPAHGRSASPPDHYTPTRRHRNIQEVKDKDGQVRRERENLQVAETTAVIKTSSMSEQPGEEIEFVLEAPSKYHSPKSAGSPSGHEKGAGSSPDAARPDPGNRKRKWSAEVEDDDDLDGLQYVNKRPHKVTQKKYRNNLSNKIAALRDNVPTLGRSNRANKVKVINSLVISCDS